MPGFWDQDAVKAAAANADYASLVKVGDKSEGEIAKLSMRTFNAGTDKERTAIEIKYIDSPTLTAGQTMLKQGLFELQPEKGDQLSVELGEVQKMGEKTMKRFVIRVSKPNGEVLEIDQRQSADSNGIKIIADALPTPPPAAKRSRATTKPAPEPAPDEDDDLEPAPF